MTPPSTGGLHEAFIAEARFQPAVRQVSHEYAEADHEDLSVGLYCHAGGHVPGFPFRDHAAAVAEAGVTRSVGPKTKHANVWLVPDMCVPCDEDPTVRLKGNGLGGVLRRMADSFDHHTSPAESRVELSVREIPDHREVIPTHWNGPPMAGRSASRHHDLAVWLNRQSGGEGQLIPRDLREYRSAVSESWIELAARGESDDRKDTRNPMDASGALRRDRPGHHDLPVGLDHEPADPAALPFAGSRRQKPVAIKGGIQEPIASESDDGECVLASVRMSARRDDAAVRLDGHRACHNIAGPELYGRSAGAARRCSLLGARNAEKRDEYEWAHDEAEQAPPHEFAFVRG